MGIIFREDQPCTVQYHFQIQFPPEAMSTTWNLTFFALALIGAYHVGRHIGRILRDHCPAWVLSTWRPAAPTAPLYPGTGATIAEPALPPRLRPAPLKPRASPGLRPTRPRSPAPKPALPSPGSLAILAPAPHPPPALVQALNQYQAQLDHPRPTRTRRQSAASA